MFGLLPTLFSLIIIEQLTGIQRLQASLVHGEKNSAPVGCPVRHHVQTGPLKLLPDRVRVHARPLGELRRQHGHRSATGVVGSLCFLETADEEIDKSSRRLRPVPRVRQLRRSYRRRATLPPTSTSPCPTATSSGSFFSASSMLDTPFHSRTSSRIPP